MVVLAATTNYPKIRPFDGRLTAPGGVTANLTGNVTGNVTGDVTGNVTGNVTGVSTGADESNLPLQVTEHPDKSSLLVGLTQNMMPLRLTAIHSSCHMSHQQTHSRFLTLLVT